MSASASRISKVRDDEDSGPAICGTPRYVISLKFWERTANIVLELRKSAQTHFMGQGIGCRGTQLSGSGIPYHSITYRVRHKDLPIENVTLLKNDLVFEDAFNI